MKNILEYLKKHGESLDTEISAATGLPLIKVHQHMSELTAKGEVMVCNATRYEDGNKVEVMICRLVGHGPVVKKGKKAKPQVALRQ
jgi:DNA-binding IclR family transcriptional regulator